jgi:hypothetical protein
MVNRPKKKISLSTFESSLQEHVVRTLLYYDIFRYPLNADEIYRFLGFGGVDKATLNSCLTSLRNRGIIFQFGDFYSTNNDGGAIGRRIKGNSAAEALLPVAQKKAILISKFPFVRGVLASGSLSKGYIDDKSDIDFFIITVPNRLWIARTLLVLYKKIFLFNSRKHFCVNYFVDETHLEIEEKNIFTATELATIIPLYGSQQYELLHESNRWLKDFFPNFHLRSTERTPGATSQTAKRLLEKFLNGFFAEWLEKFCRHLTLARWKKQHRKNYTPEDFDIAFKSKSYASKHHPSNFQRTVIETYEEKLRHFGVTVPGFYLVQREDLVHSTSDA